MSAPPRPGRPGTASYVPDGPEPADPWARLAPADVEAMFARVPYKRPGSALLLDQGQWDLLDTYDRIAAKRRAKLARLGLGTRLANTTGARRVW